MSKLSSKRNIVFGVGALACLSVLASGTIRAQERARATQWQPVDLHSLRMVDFFNLFPHVGALLVWGEPNDAGIPEGLLTRCTGTLVHERVLLTAGHCVAWAAGGIRPFIKFSVTFSPNALDRSTWRDVSGYIAHPSLPPCPPPDLCTFRGLDPDILDIGLVFLSEPVRHITPARLARPDTLQASGVTGSLMVLPGYGDLDSIPGGGPQPRSAWDGWRRIKISRFALVVAPEWASWSVPGVVCFGDSGSPTFRYDPSNRRTDERVVAVASDGGDVCFSRDDRARVDTTVAHDWVRRTIAQAIPKR
jgi:hypothetical protein